MTTRPAPSPLEELGAARLRDARPEALLELTEDAIDRAAAGGDTRTLESIATDGSISIPLFEEELVVSRRLVLRERVVVRKETITNWREITTQLRREEVELDEAAGDE